MSLLSSILFLFHIARLPNTRVLFLPPEQTKAHLTLQLSLLSTLSLTDPASTLLIFLVVYLYNYD